VEIQDRQTVAVHHDVARAVDAFLRGRSLSAEIRYRDERGAIQTEAASLSKPEPAETLTDLSEAGPGELPPTREVVHIYPYGVSQNRLRQAARGLRLPVDLVDEVRQADVLMTLKSYYRKRPQPIADAERLGVPVFVLRSNTVTQMESSLADIFALSAEEMDPFAVAMRETQDAIHKVLAGSRSVELAPQAANIRRRQHELARKFNLVSHSRGREPQRRVRIYRE
jgi:hypothetical protein